MVGLRESDVQHVEAAREDAPQLLVVLDLLRRVHVAVGSQTHKRPSNMGSTTISFYKCVAKMERHM